MSGNDDVERQWREAVRRQREDEAKKGPPPYQGNYGGGDGCLIALMSMPILAGCVAARDGTLWQLGKKRPARMKRTGHRHEGV
jgi:hypothetical protein